jgi:ketosteroid isomerase-like protein
MAADEGGPDAGSRRMERALDQLEIRDVIYRYCRGIDRRDFELVRSCYHPDAIDDHGNFCGGRDEFVTYVSTRLVRFERTMHVIGNVLIEPVGDQARAESYIVAYHRLAGEADGPARDLIVGLRYVDDFERRDGEWRIAARMCVFEWSRVDPVADGWTVSAAATFGRTDGTDPVFAPSVRNLFPS